jgi:hypothetical protein
VNQLNRLKLLLSNAPVGRHPDEEKDGLIHNPDGTIIKPEVQLAEGGAGFADTEPVNEGDIPATDVGGQK